MKLDQTLASHKKFTPYFSTMRKLSYQELTVQQKDPSENENENENLPLYEGHYENHAHVSARHLK